MTKGRSRRQESPGLHCAPSPASGSRPALPEPPRLTAVLEGLAGSPDRWRRGEGCSWNPDFLWLPSLARRSPRHTVQIFRTGSSFGERKPSTEQPCWGSLLLSAGWHSVCDGPTIRGEPLCLGHCSEEMMIGTGACGLFWPHPSIISDRKWALWRCHVGQGTLAPPGRFSERRPGVVGFRESSPAPRLGAVQTGLSLPRCPGAAASAHSCLPCPLLSWLCPVPQALAGPGIHPRAWPASFPNLGILAPLLSSLSGPWLGTPGQRVASSVCPRPPVVTSQPQSLAVWSVSVVARDRDSATPGMDAGIGCRLGRPPGDQVSDGLLQSRPPELASWEQPW